MSLLTVPLVASWILYGYATHAFDQSFMSCIWILLFCYLNFLSPLDWSIRCWYLWSIIAKDFWSWRRTGTDSFTRIGENLIQKWKEKNPIYLVLKELHLQFNWMSWIFFYQKWNEWYFVNEIVKFYMWCSRFFFFFFY